MKEKTKKICECCFLENKKQLVECLAGAGFCVPEVAADNLISFKERLPSPDLLEFILPPLLQSCDPDRGLGNILRFARNTDPSFWPGLIGNHEALDASLAVFAGSQHLSEVIFSQWEVLEWSRWFLPYDDDYIKTDLAGRISSADSSSAFLNAIKRFKDFWYLNTGARDLLRLDPTDVVLKRLSLVADICLDAVYYHFYRELEEKHGAPMEENEQGEPEKSTGVIIGMGKLGGNELNFSSDIDLIFIFSSEKGDTVKGFADDLSELPNPHKISNQEFFTLLAQKITRIIGETLKIFRVDLDLRPEGKSGAITQCLTGAEIYYESWGQSWERMAMIKARPVAGDPELGQRFLETIHPFVYRKYLDQSSFNEIRTMRDRIKQKLETEGKDRPVDVKLGDGGIREIEFIVQTFQVIYGGKNPGLQKRGTIETLGELGGLLGAGEVEVLERAYFFLRDIENRLQMLQGRQTHLLPVKGEEQTALARKMDISEGWDSFWELYRHHTQGVKNIFDKLFTPTSAPPQKSSRRKRGQNKVSPTQFAEGELEAFENPKKIRALISLLKEGHTYEYPTQRARELFNLLLPRLLGRIKSQPDPEQALNRLEEFTRGFGAREALFGFLLENELIFDLLVQILGTGGILCERLIQFPGFLDLISRSENFWEEKSAHQMRREIEESQEATSSDKEKLELLAKYKMEEEFRIGFRLIAKNSDPLPIFEELSLLAQLYLEQIVHLACHEADETSSPAGQFAVIAVGKFAGKELDFGSDLDIVFISADSQDSSFIHRICRKVIQLSQTVTRYGVPYRIDLDLRPYGKSGPLVLPLSGFSAYYQKNAKPWERMAWIRSRVVFGEGDLVCRIHEIIKDFVYNSGLDKKGTDEIEQVWKRVHQEKITASKGKVSLKFGSGGLFDLEFITQMFQLKWGQTFPDIQRAHTYQAILALEQNQCVPAGITKQLKTSYMFLRNLESRLRLTQNQPGDWIGLSEDQWDVLSKRMRFYHDCDSDAGKNLQKTFHIHTSDIKQIRSDIGLLL